VPTHADAPPTTAATRRSALDRSAAMTLAADEYARFAEQLAALAPEDWNRPTACPAWDVHALACHVLGMAEMFASPVEQVRQLAAAKRAGGLLVDALTALQVEKHRARTPADLVERMAAIGPRAARGRRRTPAPMRRLVTLKGQPVDETGSVTEPWALGYLVDVILTRDTWMHRSDVCHATGRPMVRTAGHDGVLVADIVQEWAERHGQPCTLVLAGPAGGSWTWGDGGPTYELDAVEFCRVLSGRGAGEGLLVTRVPF
jgi:uncharacterized protein (TIGR03083 family)